MTDLLNTWTCMDLVRVAVDLRFTFFTLNLDQHIDEINFVRLLSGVVCIFYLSYRRVT